MAGLDYAGLLTGISPQSAKIDPFSLPTAGQQRMAFGAQQAQGVQRAGEGLFKLQSGSPQEIAKTEMYKLDRADPQYEQKFIKLLSIADPAKAEELVEKNKQQTALKESTNAFEDYIAKNYPELTGLVSKGVITPSNFKQFLDDKKDAGTVVKGTTFTVQDENNNAFTMIPTLNNKTGKFENKFAPIGGGPSTPVGKTVITGGEFAQTATDDALRRINKDVSTTEGQEFVKNKATALDTIPVLSAQKEELSQALTLLNSVETGGPINLVGTALENYFGTKSADKATLEIILGDNTFKALKPLFGGLISEGERAEIMKIYPNLQKGNAANRGIILRLQNILDNALLRGQMYQRSDTVEDYKRLMNKLYPVDADKKPTENVVVWGVRD